MALQSAIRQNYHEDSEAALNSLINLVRNVSQVYCSMATHFDREDEAMKGFRKKFAKFSDKRQVRAEQLMAYQNQRGGQVLLEDISRPEKDAWETVLDAMNEALVMEISLNQSLLHLHQVSESCQDVSMSGWIETELLRGQSKTIKKLGDHITNLKRVGCSGLGAFLFDRKTMRS